MEVSESKINQRVKRINKKIRQNYPLFFDHFKTDFDTEKQNAINKKLAFQEWLKENDAFQVKQLEDVVKYIKIARCEGLNENIIKTFHFVMNLGLGTEYLLDGMCRSLAEKWNVQPYQAHEKIEQWQQISTYNQS